MDENVAQPHPKGIAGSCEIFAQSSRIVSQQLHAHVEDDTLGSIDAGESTMTGSGVFTQPAPFALDASRPRASRAD